MNKKCDVILSYENEIQLPIYFLLLYEAYKVKMYSLLYHDTDRNISIMNHHIANNIIAILYVF